MASVKHYFTIFSLLFITFSLSSTPSLSENLTPPSVFDILAQYGLPIGLLPDCVKSHSLADDGSFVVELEHTCYIKFDYLVYYEKRITGTLKLGSITNLKGIQVKQFLFWFKLDEIKVDLPPSDSIYFQVGLVNKKLSVHQFDTIHTCRSSTSAARAGYLRSLSSIFELPLPVDGEIPMLVTE